MPWCASGVLDWIPEQLEHWWCISVFALLWWHFIWNRGAWLPTRTRWAISNLSKLMITEQCCNGGKIDLGTKPYCNVEFIWQNLTQLFAKVLFFHLGHSQCNVLPAQQVQCIYCYDGLLLYKEFVNSSNLLMYSAKTFWCTVTISLLSEHSRNSGVHLLLIYNICSSCTSMISALIFFQLLKDYVYKLKT